MERILGYQVRNPRNATMSDHPTRKQTMPWILPLALATLAGLAGAVTTWIQRPVYRVQAQVMAVSAPGDMDPKASLLMGTVASQPAIIGGLFRSRAALKSLSEHLGLREQDVERSYFVETDTASGVIGITLDHFSASAAVKALEVLFVEVRQLELESSQSSATVLARQLGKALQARQREYQEAQDDFAALLTRTRTPFNGELKTISEFTRTLEELRSELKGTEALMAEAKRSLNEGLAQPGWPKGDGGEQADGHLELLRQKVAEATATVENLRRRLGPQSPEQATARADLSAAQGVYDRELAAARRSVRLGLEQKLLRLEAQRTMLRFQLEARTKLVNRAPLESSQVAGAVKNLAVLRSGLNDLRTRHELAKVEAEAARVRWSVLSDPGFEDRPINKRYLRTPLTAGLVGLLLGVLIQRSRRPAAGAAREV